MPKSDQSRQDTNLDVLRAIAVLLVVGYHAMQMYSFWTPDPLKVGRSGVLIFFVHTSLVLMMSLERMAARRSRIAMSLSFYAQRAFRIYPLSILCVLTVVLCHVPDSHVPIHVSTYVPPSAGQLVLNLLLLQNAARGNLSQSVSGPLWSLPFEVQMYVLLPFFYLLLKRRPGTSTMAMLIALSLALGSVQLVAHDSLKWLSPLGKIAQFFPCFMGGILGFRLRRVQNALLPAALWPVWIIGLVVLYWKVSFFGDSFVLCLVLGATMGLFREMKAGRTGLAAHAIAKYSYGIYLAHVPLYWLCFAKLPIASQGASWGIFLVLLVLVPVILFQAVESPMIALGRRLTTARLIERSTPVPMPLVAGNPD